MTGDKVLSSLFNFYATKVVDGFTNGCLMMVWSHIDGIKRKDTLKAEHSVNGLRVTFDGNSNVHLTRRCKWNNDF